MSKHDHASCEHDVAWCRHCDVAYCQHCDITWTRGLRLNFNPGAAQIPGIFYNTPQSPPPGLGVPIQPPNWLTGQIAHAHGGAVHGSG